MKAIVHNRYGPPQRLELLEINKPEIADDTVLVRVRAASLNPVDWHFMRGEPYVMRLISGLRRPKRRVPGVDLAGVVEAVGKDVTLFKPGDEVFGAAQGGALAEHALGNASSLAAKPPALTFEEAAAIPVAGLTALQALRDKGALKQGQTVLINGAAGGVGTFAVQLAAAFGAEVTGVCSTGNLELVLSLGADHVVDYTREDFARGAQRYDLIVDAVGNRSLSDLRRSLTPNGTLVLIGGGGGRLLGPLALALKAMLLSRFARQKLVFFITKPNKADLLTLTRLIQDDKLAPVIDRTYALSQAAEAMCYLEAGHARGKVVITVP